MGRAGQWIRLRLGDYLIAAGRRADAETHLMSIVSDYNSDAIKDSDGEGMALVGRATYLLRSYHDSVKAFGDAEGADPNHVQTHVWSSKIFLDKYNPGDAEKSLKLAMKVAPKNPDVLVMLGRIRIEQTMDFDE